MMTTTQEESQGFRFGQMPSRFFDDKGVERPILTLYPMQ